MTRRLLTAAALALGVIFIPVLGARAQEQAPAASVEPGEWRHGASLMGEPKYPPGFERFDYVNPDAPKGGRVRFGVLGSFDNLNPIVAGIRGDLASGLGLVYDTLMADAMDEPSTMYGLVAEAMRYPPDYSSVTFRLDPNARWHDGTPITVEDVIWSFDTLKAANPFYAQYYRNVLSGEETGEREVTFAFDERNNRELPKIMGQLLILPKHWWTDPARSADATTLEPPLGSGPYRVGAVAPGRSIAYERVPDYWAAEHPTNIGKNNFDTQRFEYFRDETVLIEAFKADQIDYRAESVARNWATAYEFPARSQGRVVLETFPIRSRGIMQAYVFNLRQERFRDERVRRAFNLAFDFEDINRTIFFGAYERIDSFFDGLEFASSGLPEGRELEILEAYRGRIPESVFTEPYVNPDNSTGEDKRVNLRRAFELLTEAGYELRGGTLVDAETGEPFVVEFLGFRAADERHVLPYAQALQRLGIRLTPRTIDIPQYQNRVRSFDFDMITSSWAQSLSPGNEQRDFWGSAAAQRQGSRNVAGIADPVIDELIERVVFAEDRAELEAASKALDRVLLHNHFVVPQWTITVERVARWDRFSRPETLPDYAGDAFPTIWWYDEAKAQRTGAAR